VIDSSVQQFKHTAFPLLSTEVYFAECGRGSYIRKRNKHSKPTTKNNANANAEACVLPVWFTNVPCTNVPTTIAHFSKTS
jgi:hypothetical protein